MHPPIKAGERFGYWTVLADATGWPDRRRLVTCQCECGAERTIPPDNLRRGLTQSCGCRSLAIRRERASGKVLISRLPEHGVWMSIRERCLYPGHPRFEHYGGRGITMCDEWQQDFRVFFEHVGPRPSPLHSIDRIDNNRGYEPGNVRWATAKEQDRNRRNNRLLEFQGEVRCLSEWAEVLGVSIHVIRYRVRRGWPATKIFEGLLKSEAA